MPAPSKCSSRPVVDQAGARFLPIARSLVRALNTPKGPGNVRVDRGERDKGAVVTRRSMRPAPSTRRPPSTPSSLRVLRPGRRRGRSLLHGIESRNCGKRWKWRKVCRAHAVMDVANFRIQSEPAP